MSEVKKCGSCREVKTTDEFVARRDGSGKFLPRCKECRDGEAQQKRTKKMAVGRQPTNLARTPLKPMSERRKNVNQQRKEAMLAHFGKREFWKCMGQDTYPHKCHGGINGHEILSRSRAGRTDANLLDMSGIITICDWLNTYIEDNPNWAHEMGFTKHSWE